MDLAVDQAVTAINMALRAYEAKDELRLVNVALKRCNILLNVSGDFAFTFSCHPEYNWIMERYDNLQVRCNALIPGGQARRNANATQSLLGQQGGARGGHAYGTSVKDKKLNEVQGQVDEVAGILRNNMDKVLQRSNNIYDIAAKAQTIKTTASIFDGRSRRLRQKLGGDVDRRSKTKSSLWCSWCCCCKGSPTKDDEPTMRSPLIRGAGNQVR